MPVFEQARALGRLAELEAAAIRAARVVALPGLLLSVNVDIGSLPSPAIREALSGDLSDLVLEVTEHTHSPVDPEVLAGVLAALRDYRDRGALVAVDDWGTGYSDMDRLELLQPEIVKVDMSIVQDLESARHRALHRLGPRLVGPPPCPGVRRGHRVRGSARAAASAGRPPRPGLPHRPTRAAEQDADRGRLTLTG